MRYARQILAGLILVGVIVLLFVLIFKGFRSNQSTPIKQTDLVTYANTGAVAEFYIDGPINLDQDHRTVKIAVSQNQTQIQVVQGYQGSVIQSESFPNNTESYAVFLQALKNLNFAKGNTSAALGDERGYCADGARYIYRFTNSGDTLFRYWSTSCGQGTFGGNRQAVRRLFERQVPEKTFNQLTNGISLS